MSDRLALIEEISGVRATYGAVVSLRAQQVAQGEALVREIEEYLSTISTTPIRGASLALERGETVELQVLLPLVDQMFYGELGLHINRATGTIDSRPLGEIELLGAEAALAMTLGSEVDFDEFFIEDDARHGMWLRFTVEQATNLVFARNDAR